MKFEDHHMKTPSPFRVNADFECFNQPQNDHKVWFKQFPIEVGYYLVSPFGKFYYSCFGEGCVSWFVNKMFTLEKITSEYFSTILPLQITPQEEVKFQQSDVC